MKSSRKGKVGKTKLWRSDGRGRNHKFGPRKMLRGLCWCNVCEPFSKMKEEHDRRICEEKNNVLESPPSVEPIGADTATNLA